MKCIYQFLCFIHSHSLIHGSSQSSIRSANSVEKNQSSLPRKPFINFDTPISGSFIPGSSQSSHFGIFTPSLNSSRASSINEQISNPMNELTGEKNLVISNLNMFQSINEMIVTITVVEGCCNDPSCTRFDVSTCLNLKTIQIGNNCFQNVTEFSLKKMESLTELTIGANCFRALERSHSTTQFYLEENDSLLAIKIGANSFEYYSDFILKGIIL